MLKTRNCPICYGPDNVNIDWILNDEKKYSLTHTKVEKKFIDKIELVYCQFCKLVYYSKYPDSLNELYARNYRSNGEFELRVRLRDNEAKSMLFFENIRNFLKPKMSVLDVGCAEGFFVKYLVEKGLHAEGLEINDDSVKFGRKYYDATIYDYDVTKHIKKYDFVFTSGYFEHLENPRQVLEHIRDHCLTQDGMIYIGCPNLECPNTVFLSEYFPPEHLQTFSPSTLSNLLDCCGFDVVEIIRDNYNFGMALIAKKTDYQSRFPKYNEEKIDIYLGELKKTYDQKLAKTDFFKTIYEVKKLKKELRTKIIIGGDQKLLLGLTYILSAPPDKILRAYFEISDHLAKIKNLKL